LDGLIYEGVIENGELLKSVYTKHLFYLYEADITLDVLTLQNVEGDDFGKGSGGILFANSSNLHINYCTVQRGAAIFGSLLYAYGSDVKITNSVLGSVAAATSAIAIDGSKGRLQMDGCLITGGLESTLNRNIFKNNGAFFSIFDESKAPTFEESTISNTIFANNRANEDGYSYKHAVEILSKTHRLKLDNVLVANNDFEERVILAGTYTGTTRITTYNFTNRSIINNEIENDGGIISNGGGGSFLSPKRGIVQQSVCGQHQW